MNEWPIQRSWRVISPESHPKASTTDELAEEPVCCLLGAAGMGKTFEMGRLRRREQEKGRVVRSERLAELATRSCGHQMVNCGVLGYFRRIMIEAT
jgi:hypothetical protein